MTRSCAQNVQRYVRTTWTIAIQYSSRFRWPFWYSVFNRIIRDSSRRPFRRLLGGASPLSVAARLMSVCDCSSFNFRMNVHKDGWRTPTKLFHLWWNPKVHEKETLYNAIQNRSEYLIGSYKSIYICAYKTCIYNF